MIKGSKPPIHMGAAMHDCAPAPAPETAHPCALPGNKLKSQYHPAHTALLV